MRSFSILSLLLVFCASGVAYAQVSGPYAPDTLSFQGYVTDPGGAPITDTLDITTTFYKNGIAGYSQVHSNVGIHDGLFNLLIGPVDTVRFNQPIEIGIQIGADPEISPRTPLVSAPFALGIRGMHAIEAQDASYTGLNMIGGWHENYVSSGAVGATISGGGGIRGSTTEPDSVTSDFGTVGGGLGNRAALLATVGGGRLNRALGNHATVGGGLQNTASDGIATVAGGEYNWVTGIAGTVGGGYFNEVDSYGTVAGGSHNDAQGDHSTIPGGGWNNATGDRSFAAGWAADAAHFGSFVWADGINTNPPTLWSSTGENQFLIKAAGGVGIGTNAPEEQLHILQPSGSTGLKLGGDGTSGPHGIIFEDDTDNAGVQLFWRTSGNQLVLERSSAGTGTDGSDALMYDRDDQRFVFNGFRNTSASFGGHVVSFDNKAGGSADGIAIRLGVANPGGGNNFISFFDSAYAAYGRIEGNGTNGVVYASTGGDYAEYMQRLNHDERISAGDVVAVLDGRVTHTTRGANRLMVITDRPAVMGNMPDPASEGLYERVAFVGQVPVKVVGPVTSGDYLLASGNDDGSAIARRPEALHPDDLDSIVGVAWESSSQAEIKKVIAEVGLDRARATKAAFENELTGLRAQVRKQEERLAALEARLVN